MTIPTPPLLVLPIRTKFSRRWRLFLTTNLAILFTILAVPWMSAAHAQDVEESRGMSVLKFTSGVISAYAYHEVGHALAAAATNTDMEWGVGTYNQPLGFTEKADSDSSGFLVHASGLTTQLIASEIILQADSIDKNDNFVRGMMFWNIINPLIYAIDYWYLRHANREVDDCFQGDLQGIENYSDRQTANLFTIGMVALTFYQGYRFAKTQDWAPEWIKSDAVRLSFHSQGRNSVMLGLTFDF